MLVSSHLISEMALTAERLVVIGRGTLIAETSVEEFAAQHQAEAVRVVTPTPQLLVTALSKAGVRPTVSEDGGIVVTGVPSAAGSGRSPPARPSPCTSSRPIRASLEDAFMELTSDSVEYRSHGRRASSSRRPLIDHRPQKGLVVTIALSLPATTPADPRRTGWASARPSPPR